MKKPVLFRKRYIPSEIVELKDDIILYRDDSMLITRWTTLKPRHDIAGGISLTRVARYPGFTMPSADFSTTTVT